MKTCPSPCLKQTVSRSHDGGKPSPPIAGFAQARREPQRGPGNYYHGALSLPHSVCAERNRGEGCPLIIRLGVWGERRKLTQRGPQPKMDFMHILGQKEAT